MLVALMLHRSPEQSALLTAWENHTRVHAPHWKFLADPAQTRAVVWHDGDLQLLAQVDGFASVQWTCSGMLRDRHPQFRTLAWCPTSDIIACASSSGHIHIVDAAKGKHWYSITAQADPLPDADPLAPRLAFVVSAIGFTKVAKWKTKMFALGITGAMSIYLLDGPGSTTQYMLQASLPTPSMLLATSLQFISSHQLIVVCGKSSTTSSESHPCSNFKVFRAVDESPYLVKHEFNMLLAPVPNSRSFAFVSKVALSPEGKRFVWVIFIASFLNPAGLHSCRPLETWQSWRFRPSV